MGKPFWPNVTGSTVKKARVYTTKKNRKKIQYNTRVVDDTWERMCKFNLGDVSPFSLDDSPVVKRLDARTDGQEESPVWSKDGGLCGEEAVKRGGPSPCKDVTSDWNNRTAPSSNKENNLKHKKKTRRVQNALDMSSDSDFLPSQKRKRKAPARQKKACSKKGTKKARTKAPVKTGQYSSNSEVQGKGANHSGLGHVISQKSMNFSNTWGEDETSPTYNNVLGDASLQNDKSSSSHAHNSSFFDELVRQRLDKFVTRDRKANTPPFFASPLDGTPSQAQRESGSTAQLESPSVDCMEPPVVMLSNISNTSNRELMENIDVVLAKVSSDSSEVLGSPKELSSAEFVVPESPIEEDASELCAELSPEATLFRTSTPCKQDHANNLRQESKRKPQGTRKQPSRRTKQSKGEADAPPPKRRRAKSRTTEDDGHDSNPRKVAKTKPSQGTRKQPARRTKQSKRDADAPPPMRHRAKSRITEDDGHDSESCHGNTTSKDRTLRTRQKKKSSKSVTPCSVIMSRLSEDDIQRLSAAGNRTSRRKKQSGNVRECQKDVKKGKNNKRTSAQQRQKSSTDDCFKTPKTPALRAVFTPNTRDLSTPGCRVTPTSSRRAKSPGSGVKQTPLRGSAGIPSRTQSNIMSPLFKKAVQNRLRMSPKEKLLLHCEQERILTFQECIPSETMKKCKKIGEGVFGEVFQTTKENGDKVAIKIIPIEGDFLVNDEPQKKFDEILPEIIISRELSELKHGTRNQTSGFTPLHRVCLVQGTWPKHLLSMWDQWHKERKEGSENDRPDMFPDSQLFIVMEFADGGCDLEHYQFHSLSQGKAVLHQICVALAVAEEALEFEHRDLHWGNVLVKKMDSGEKISTHRLNGEEVCIPTSGLEVNIIDFTLSRMQKDGQPLYCDLSADPTLFTGEGDYQFDIYRKMKEENQNDWKRHHPFTNVLWLDYLASKLLTKKFKSSKKCLKPWEQKFQTFRKEVLKCRTVAQVLKECQLFKDK
ncbi:serine/threonine-protein kinase haspin-like [Branchiostoma floridae]|uniref:Serine/threonine-protein kinase haspin n=1 Tax=Branchiostoma floridae TaxID=7739 RepID=A0A9J7KXI4_BRAFL|nr:serine/threonine-protein kinase haspin-like [Branchiostoma floridae]